MLVLQSVQTDRLVSSQIPTQGVSEYEGDDPIRLSPDGHTDINICINIPLCVGGCLMTMSTCPPLSTILGPGVQLGVPRICLRHIFAAAVQVFTAQRCTTASASSHTSCWTTAEKKLFSGVDPMHNNTHLGHIQQDSCICICICICDCICVCAQQYAAWS